MAKAGSGKSNDKFKAVLSNGLTVELVGVRLLSYSSPRYLKGFHVTENEQLFAECISFVGVFPLKPFLKDGYLHLLLIDLVTKKDDLLVFGVCIHFRKSFKALRLRALPENPAARMTALMIISMATLIISILFVMGFA